MTTSTFQSSVFEGLQSRIAGEVLLPESSGYARLGTPWNVAMASARPVRAVVAVADSADIAATVRFAADHGLRVAVQRTGHGAVPFASEDVVLVHTARLGEVSVDPAARTARVGAGALWQNVLDAVTPYGLAPICGSSATIGVAGYLTGAGIGPLVRTYGVSSDHVRAFDLVTGDGDVLHVTPDEHSELFWGLRGGKASLGIVASAELDLVELTSFHGGTLYFDGDDAAPVLHAWQQATENLPEQISTSVAILQLPELPYVPGPLAGRMTVAVRIASVGDPDGAEAFAERVRGTAAPVLGELREVPYAQIGSIHADPVDPMPAAEHSGLLSEVSPELIDSLVASAGPGSGSPQAIVELRLLGGAVDRAPSTPSAFCHRGAAANLTVIGVPVPPIAERVEAHAEEVMAAVAPSATGGVLPNFAPSAKPAAQSRRYDEDTLRRLGELADRHDPAGVLRIGQVVRRPAAGA